MSQEIVELTQQLLESISSGDWKTYTQLCDPTLTCFEPEAQGHLVEGMEFHKFYFDLQSDRAKSHSNVTIASPHVRLVGESVAIISYTRLVQALSSDMPYTKSFEETRVWEKQDGDWKHVHFHRSRPAKSRPGRWMGKRGC
jgi:calcium/calmodulin-dependent protein kinase (CaM kinase) II